MKVQDLTGRWAKHQFGVRGHPVAVCESDADDQAAVCLTNINLSIATSFWSMNLNMNRMIVMAHCCLLFLLIGCAVNGVTDGIQHEKPWTLADQGTEDALASGDYNSAINIVLKQAEAGNPEMQFWVGYLYLEWLGDSDAKEPPKHTAKDALIWIYNAARAGVPQAASTLRNGYEWGRYTLPKNSELEACWRKVEFGEQEAGVCITAEKSMD